MIPRGPQRQYEMTERTRKTSTAAFKAKVGLEAIRGHKTTNEIAQEYGVHLVQVGQWKQAITAQAGTLFETQRGRQPAEESTAADRLYREIGRLKVERDRLKKSRVCACMCAPRLDRASGRCVVTPRAEPSGCAGRGGPRLV